MKKRRRWPKPKPKPRRWSVTRRPCPFKPLRGVFFGTSSFAVPALHAFARALDCALVVSQPDRPAGRGQKVRPSPVKGAARELGLPTIEPARLRDALPELASARADLFAVASYGKIVPQALLDMPQHGALNVHPSLLPLYRGATPLQSQLRDGVVESGVTIIVMDAGMDTGDIAIVERRTIGPRETFGELHDRFAALGADLLARACGSVAAGSLERTSQAGLASEEAIARTLTRPLSKEDLLIDWRWPAKRIVDHVRSLSPQPGARGRFDGEAELVKVLEARETLVHTPEELVVPCGAGELVAIERLVPPNRKPMSGARYVATARAAAARAR